ncbi:protein-glutamine gamma-glutamyltransferase [Paenibacillus sp. TRM 82003]|nr:protein-glutamine gamma-glutamyltransferase [Paenibacillus sp. TRM 82003]
MITIKKGSSEPTTSSLHPASDTERALLRLIASRTSATYPSERDLSFEMRMRDATMNAARELNGSGAAFATFETSRCNETYWIREANGAFRLRPDVTPAAAMRDIFANGGAYGFECATAIVIVFYKAALDTIGEEAYNRLFANTYLFHWNVDRDLGLSTRPTSRFVPGDALYFDNPDVNPATMQWQGENVIYMGGDAYYGHGIGIARAETIVGKLNSHRRPGATRSAFLLQQATRPDYVRLSQAAGGVAGAGALPGMPGGLPYQARIGETIYVFG